MPDALSGGEGVKVLRYDTKEGCRELESRLKGELKCKKKGQHVQRPGRVRTEYTW